LAWRVAHPHNDDHENGLIHDDPTRGEAGAIAPRTMALFAIGFVLGAVAIGSMGIAITPEDPPAVRPIELRSPEQRDGSGDGADRRGDGVEPRRGPERRERSRPGAPAAPQPRRQPPKQTAPPAQAPRSRTPAPRPTPAPRSRTRPQPAPSAPAPPQPAPAPPPADDEGGEDPGGDDDTTGDDAGGTGALDDDVD
jgi:hypothetical protein